MNSNLGAGPKGGLQGILRPWKKAMKERESALARTTQAGAVPGTSQPAARSYPILWIDGVGGFSLVDRDEVIVGQAVASSTADIQILGDLSRQAAAIRRSKGDYLLQPLQPTLQNGIPVERPQLLQDGDQVQLGERVRFQFHKPNALSATARLDLISVNRFKPHVNGILLLSGSCILGPQPGSHVSCSSWANELLMFRHGEEWYFRTLEEVQVNGEPAQGQIQLVPGMRLNGSDFSLSLEGAFERASEGTSESA